MTWNKPRAERLDLPSGNVAECKKPDVMSLVMHNAGEIPDFLTGRLTGRLTGKTKAAAPDGEIKAEDWPKLALFIDLIVKASMVNPRIVAENANNETTILLEDVSGEDRMFIFMWAMPSDEAAAAESFRRSSGNPDDLQPAHDGGGLRRVTVRDVGANQPVD